MMPKLVVYTALYGNYDTLRDQPHNPDVEYRCYGDTPQPSKTWKFIKQNRHQPTVVRDARRVKTLSHYYVTQCMYCTWMDTNLLLWDDPLKICEKYLKDADFALFRHPHRDCIYDEVRACIEYRKDKPEIMKRQVERYRAEGYPEHGGLASTGFLLRRQTEAVIRFNEMWWAEIENGSHRDQLSLPYVHWKTGLKFSVIPGSIRTTMDLPSYLHKPYKG